jgi:hypothetical protein
MAPPLGLESTPIAIGAAAKHSQGEFPLVFSTELARDTSVGVIEITLLRIISLTIKIIIKV